MTAVQPKTHRHGICEANEMVGLGGTYKVILDGVAYVLISATIDDPREGPEVVTLTLIQAGGTGTKRYMYSHERLIWTKR